MKPKLSVYLSDHVAERLALAAKRPGANKSAIVDAALDRFLNPEEAARALGRDRFEMFVAQVGRRVASGNRLVSEILERLSTGNPDLFNRSLDDGVLLSGQTVDADRSPATDAAGRQPEPPPAGREEVGHV